MPFFPKYRLFCLAALLLGAFVLWTSCKKDYSFEGRNTVITPPDPPPPPPPVVPGKYPSCAACAGQDGFVQGRWSFKIDTILFCGTITDAVISPDRTGFTFFGPSQCSEDTGLIMTAFLPEPLTTTFNNISTPRSSLQYYDRTTFIDMFAARIASGLTLYLDSYDHVSRKASGRFSGYAYAKNGVLETVKEGKFMITFSN